MARTIKTYRPTQIADGFVGGTIVHEDQFVREGMLLTANDSGFNQSFAAFEMAYDILEQGLSPGRMRTRTPERGPYLVNSQRAASLGITIDDKSYLIDEVINESLALTH